jgi:hypothetical protein
MSSMSNPWWIHNIVTNKNMGLSWRQWSLWHAWKDILGPFLSHYAFWPPWIEPPWTPYSQFCDILPSHGPQQPCSKPSRTMRQNKFFLPLVSLRYFKQKNGIMQIKPLRKALKSVYLCASGLMAKRWSSIGATM